MRLDGPFMALQPEAGPDGHPPGLGSLIYMWQLRVPALRNALHSTEPITQVLIELPARGACNKHGCYGRNYTDTAGVIAALEAVPPFHVARMQRAIAINAHRSGRDLERDLERARIV